LTSVLDRLIDLLLAAWRWLVPWAVLADDQVGLIRRLGVTHRIMRRGWNWKLPIVEEALEVCSALDSTALREQSLTTIDGAQVTLRCVLTYRVVDPKLWIIEVETPQTVLNDAGCLAVSELVSELNADEVLQGPEFLIKLARRVRARGRRFGIEVLSVGLADRTTAPTIRLLGKD